MTHCSSQKHSQRADWLRFRLLVGKDLQRSKSCLVGPQTCSSSPADRETGTGSEGRRSSWARKTGRSWTRVRVPESPHCFSCRPRKPWLRIVDMVSIWTTNDWIARTPFNHECVIAHVTGLNLVWDQVILKRLTCCVTLGKPTLVSCLSKPLML